MSHYPIHSVQDVIGPFIARVLPAGPGFFLFESIQLGGHTTRLYWLENSLIRRRFEEPRVHFALNCASISCPRRPTEEFRGDRLGDQLTRETKNFLSQHRHFEIDMDKGVVRLSSIFDWYTRDFGRGTKTVNRRAILFGYLSEILDEPERSALAACAVCRLEFCALRLVSQ